MGENAEQLKRDAEAKRKAATPNAREGRTTPKKTVPKSDAVQAAQKESKDKKTAAMYKEAGPAYKGAGSNFYGPSTPVVNTDSKSTNKKDKGGPNGSSDVTVTSAPVQTGLVDNINIKEQYQAEARRIILSLVKSAKDLLIKYNFSSINRIPEYVLDSDREAKSEYVVSQKSRPEPPFTPSEAEMQDRFSQDITNISNSISDMVDDSVKLAYFGTLQGGVLIPGKPKISNGISYYDMKLTIDSVSDKTFVIKCYEIS